jgi:hypothetical protein
MDKHGGTRRSTWNYPARSHELTGHLDGWADEHQKIEVAAQGDNSTHFVFANGSVKITSAPAAPL